MYLKCIESKLNQIGEQTVYQIGEQTVPFPLGTPADDDSNVLLPRRTSRTKEVGGAGVCEGG